MRRGASVKIRSLKEVYSSRDVCRRWETCGEAEEVALANKAYLSG
jgi:hypothetical protein